MITIAFCIDKPRLGGAELHLLEVLRNLNTKRFHPLLVFLGDGSAEALYPKYRESGVKIISLKMDGGGFRFDNLTKFVRLIKMLRENKVDIVQGFLLEGNFFGAMAGRLAGVPVILSSKRSIERYSWLQLYASKLANALSMRVTVVSQAVGEFVRTHEGCPESKIVVTPNGVYPDSPHISDAALAAIKKELGVSEDALVVGSVGRFKWKKGYQYFIETADLVVKQHPNVRFVAFGDGPLKTEMDAMVARKGLSPHILFPGRETDARSKMRIFDIYVCASVIEGMSNALLEAMAQGRPVVATAVGGNRENVVDGVTGYLVPPADPAAMAEKIGRLVSDPALSRRLGEAAKQRVREEYTIERMIGRLEALYAELTDQRRGELAPHGAGF